MLKLKQTLERAKELQERGWGRRVLIDKNGKCCMLGALTLAKDPNFEPPASYSDLGIESEAMALASAIREVDGDPPEVSKAADPLLYSRALSKVWQTNDQPKRTLQEILHYFDAAIRNAEE